MNQWFKTGTPFIWITAGMSALAMVMVYGVLALTAARGLGHFWPAVVHEIQWNDNGTQTTLIGERVEQEEVSVIRLRDTGVKLETTEPTVSRSLYKIGNRDTLGFDFKWVPDPLVSKATLPKGIVTIERHEYGNFYGYLLAVKEGGQTIAEGDKAWTEAESRAERAQGLFRQILSIEKYDVGRINYHIEELRLEENRLRLAQRLTPEAQERINKERAGYQVTFDEIRASLDTLKKDIARDSLVIRESTGKVVEIPLKNVAELYLPNDMSFFGKVGFYFHKFYLFIFDDPREANTEGGIFPAIFGTVMMVILMAIIVTPLGIVAAIYMREYAKNGPLLRVIRISVNNLAGVPSIVYGVFGLGFFVYFVGHNVDKWFYAEAFPAPTFGSPGIFWASLTLALLTLPVVIVATEEGLSRVPRSIREGSLALGATKAETLVRTVLPLASPAMMTGLILAIARAAGEVAPLMLVGVVKLAPSLPLDTFPPFLHLERKFMHLGFHIYDVGFQSPNVEAARPMVYATTLLLVLVIMLLNLAAIQIRNRLREKYKGLEGN